MDKRRRQRTAMTDFSFEAFDGINFYQGEIVDASGFGICMTDLPRNMQGETRKIKVTINGRGISFRMQVMPKWSSNKGCGKTLGAEILSPPIGWAEFIMNLETVQKN